MEGPGKGGGRAGVAMLPASCRPRGTKGGEGAVGAISGLTPARRGSATRAREGGSDMATMHGGLSLQELAARLAAEIEAVCAYYLPNGRRNGPFWQVGSVAGEPGSSLRVNLAGPPARALEGLGERPGPGRCAGPDPRGPRPGLDRGGGARGPALPVLARCRAPGAAGVRRGVPAGEQRRPGEGAGPFARDPGRRPGRALSGLARAVGGGCAGRRPAVPSRRLGAGGRAEAGAAGPAGADPRPGRLA